MSDGGRGAWPIGSHGEDGSERLDFMFSAEPCGKEAVICVSSPAHHLLIHLDVHFILAVHSRASKTERDGQCPYQIVLLPNPT